MTTFERLLERLEEIGERKVIDAADSNTIYTLHIAQLQAIEGLNVIGDLLAEVGLACGRAGCEPVDEIQRETLFRAGNLIVELAGIAKFCEETKSCIQTRKEAKILTT